MKLAFMAITLLTLSLSVSAQVINTDGPYYKLGGAQGELMNALNKAGNAYIKKVMPLYSEILDASEAYIIKEACEIAKPDMDAGLNYYCDKLVEKTYRYNDFNKAFDELGNVVSHGMMNDLESFANKLGRALIVLEKESKN